MKIMAALMMPNNQLLSTIKKPMPMGMDNSKAVSADNCFGDKFLVLNILLEDTRFKKNKGKKTSRKKYKASTKHCVELRLITCLLMLKSLLPIIQTCSQHLLQ